MSIKYTIPASTTTSTTTSAPVNCANPIFRLLDATYLKKSDYTSVLFAVTSLLQKGSISDNCKYCCPDCQDLYILSSYNDYTSLINDIPLINQYPCCKNISRPSGNTIGCTTTNFLTCLNNLKTIIGVTNYNTLLNDYGGFVEYSKIAGNASMICALLTELQNSPAYSPELVFNFFKSILELGIVVYCFNSSVSVTSVNSFITLEDAVPLNPFYVN